MGILSKQCNIYVYIFPFSSQAMPSDLYCLTIHLSATFKGHSIALTSIKAPIQIQCYWCIFLMWMLYMYAFICVDRITLFDWPFVKFSHLLLFFFNWLTHPHSHVFLLLKTLDTNHDSKGNQVLKLYWWFTLWVLAFCSQIGGESP